MMEIRMLLEQLSKDRREGAVIEVPRPLIIEAARLFAELNRLESE